MMSRTLGAPFGGTTRGAHQGFDSEALSLITPPNCGSGGGSCFPLRVVVAVGEPGSPVVCGAEADNAVVQRKAAVANAPNPEIEVATIFSCFVMVPPEPLGRNFAYRI